MAKDDNLGYDIEDDFDENLDKDFWPPSYEGTCDSEKNLVEVP
jgi:hypothetical protein